jgi:hypothetical protein
MKRFRAFVVLTLLFLIGGAAMNLALAWGAAWAHPVRIAPPGTMYMELYTTFPSRLHTRTLSASETQRLIDDFKFVTCGGPVSVESRSEFCPAIREEIYAPQEPNFPSADYIHAYAVGWPFPALRWWRIPALPPRPAGNPSMRASTNLGVPTSMSTRLNRFSPNDRLHHAVDMPTNVLEKVRRLPTDIIWPGFLLNSALCAAVLLLLFTLPRTGRSLLRRLRRRCPACGYDWSKSPQTPACSECGRLRPT